VKDEEDCGGEKNQKNNPKDDKEGREKSIHVYQDTKPQGNRTPRLGKKGGVRSQEDPTRCNIKFLGVGKSRRKKKEGGRVKKSWVLQKIEVRGQVVCAAANWGAQPSTKSRPSNQKPQMGTKGRKGEAGAGHGSKLAGGGSQGGDQVKGSYRKRSSVKGGMTERGVGQEVLSIPFRRGKNGGHCKKKPCDRKKTSREKKK